jgi:DNA-binding CsgD family transcriptional regulator
VPVDSLLHGRECYERREWEDAFHAFSLADAAAPLGADDLYRLAWSAGLTARDPEMLATYERLYRAHLEANDTLSAALASFWIGFRQFARGELAVASGWLARTQRLVDLHGKECVVHGWLLLPAAQRHLSAGEITEAVDCATRAAEIGERFGEADLIAFARNIHGRALLNAGRLEQGIALVDEAMVAAIGGELSPVVTGIVYCSAIATCYRVFALERVREWTAALASWCEANPQLGMFTGYCLVHRAEVMEMNGAWSDAVDEAQRAVERCARVIELEAAGHAHYRQAEIYRLRGEFDAAEAAYREASRCGFEPQPGLALLRLVQGDIETAASTSRRVVSASREWTARAKYLPAHVEIMLSVGALDEARVASIELADIAAERNADVLTAIAGHASASVSLAEGDAQAALGPARRAFAIWQRIGAPYLAVRLRVLVARACAALGDVEAAQLELECAREVFERLGAKPDLKAIHALRLSFDGKGRLPDHTLTERELQVLRLVAAGKTNKAIARELSLSEKTVDRHVSNIFGKTNVSTRAAATAFAYERKLIPMP